MKTITIRNKSIDGEVGDRIHHADQSLTRLVGLLGRDTLTAGEGLWIQPSSGVHTFGMRFPIDVVGLDRTMRVVKLWPRLKPWRISSVSLKVSSVLELAAGEIDARSIEVGHLMEAVQHCSS